MIVPRERCQCTAKVMGVWGGILFVLMVLIVFRIKVGFVDLTPFLFVVASIYLLFTKSKIHKSVVIFLLLYFVFMCYKMQVVLFNSLIDIHIDLILRDFRFLMSVVVAYAFSMYLLSSRVSPQQFIYILSGVLFLHPLVMFIQFFDPDIRFWFINNLPFADDYHAFRVNGLLNGYVPGGIFLGMISLFYFFVYAKYKKPIFLILPFFFLPLFPISGLSGMALFAIGFVFFVLLMGGRKVMFQALTIGAIFLGGLIFLYPQIVEKYPDLGTGFDRILILLDKNEGEVNASIDGSFDVLAASYSLPSDSLQLFFGNAQPSKSLYATTTSDAGLISVVHEIGLGGLILLVCLSLYIVFYSRTTLVSMLMIGVFVVFLKINVLFSRIFFDFIVLIFCLSLLSDRYRGAFLLRFSGSCR